jgi:hypothetical protein
MISKNKKFIFIHIPKTGGNSIQNILKDYSDDEIVIKKKNEDGSLEMFEVKNTTFSTGKHSVGIRYKNRWNSDVYGDYNDYYKFATIRNPWERLISLYFTQNSGRKVWNKDLFIHKVKKEPIWRSMSSFMNNININAIIRFENLDEDFDKVCNELKIPTTKLPHVNKTSREHYTKYYDQELLNLVLKYYKDDINNFNYKFGK